MNNQFLYIKIIVFISLILVNFSCIELFNPVLDINDSEAILVVECQITNEPGPFKVILSRSVPVDVMAFTDPEIGADVEINDDKGNSYHLYELKDGVYETDDKNLSGIVGNTYSLSITTNDGKQYESTPEIMLDVPPIDSVYFREVKKTGFENGLVSENTWVEIMVDAKADGYENKYFQWGFTETWQVEMLTSNIPVIFGSGESRYTSFEDISIDEVKRTCWVTNQSNSILINTSENNAKNEVEKMVVNSISPFNERIFIKYSILVKQYSLNSKLYHYFKELRASNEQTGGIYQKNPALLNGNIECCDGKGKVLGYFSASAVKSKRIFINPYDVEAETRSAFVACMYHSPKPRYITTYFFGNTENDVAVYSSNNICADCRYYGTNIKPDYWE